MTTTKTKVRRAKKAVAQNPATTTGTIGAVIVLLGMQFGWDAETQAAIGAAALVAVPIVRTLTKWYGDWRAAKAKAEAEAEAEAEA